MKTRAAVLLALCAAASFAQSPPLPPREFRAAWIATVHNIDWPSKPGLSADAQRAELRAIMQRAADLRLNAVIFQVRPQCDAFYQSSEPWSRFLTGKMGESPGYDPLAYAMQEAHARGLELHAWFNPFRALSSATVETSSRHVTKRHPEWVRRYGSQLWLDPGEPAARAYSLGIIMDVVRRYDVDGIHIDDYFYPYPIKDAGSILPFPDEATYRRHGAGLARDDWRRAGIDGFVAQLYQSIKTEKRGVKFGISPFGIWRPGVPETIEADLDSYAHLFADARRWLREGWCDYLAPQLYWPIEPAKQSFPVLLDWWRAENRAGRHVWPGLAVDRIGKDRGATEIVNQLAFTRRAGPGPGQIYWSGKNIFADRGGVAKQLLARAYTDTALVPASPWLDAMPPERPVLEKAGREIEWRTQGESAPRWWLAQWRTGGKWTSRLLPAATLSMALPPCDAFALRAVDRAGNVSEPVLRAAGP
jgi:uncharacterized lipoprotein YddW (UPF0748 family)